MSRASKFVEEIAVKRASKNQDESGAEIPDPVPLAPPVGYVRQPSITERIREMVRSEHLRRAAEEAGAETFDEADDFDVEDDPEPYSGYENDAQFEPPIAVVDKSTGVPPLGGGEGAGGPGGPQEPSKPAEAPPSSPPAAPSSSSASSS